MTKKKPAKRGRTGRTAAPSDDDTEKLSPVEAQLVEMLATGSSPRETAKALHISDRTCRRWRQKPEIQQAIRARLSDSLAVTRSILAQGSARAASSLVAMAGDRRTVADPARVSAARCVIDAAFKAIEVDELQAKLLELEARLEAALAQGGV